MMRKELVVAILVILMVTLFTTNVTQAADPIVSVQPRLIQDETMRPLDPPLDSHPTGNQYTAPVTDPASAYDNDQVTYSSTNISQQPYPRVYSRPTLYAGNATPPTNPTYAYDLNNASFAALDIVKTKVGGNYYPYLREFNVTTFNTTLVTTISSIDVHIKYNANLTQWGVPRKIWYGFVLYVGTKKTVLQPLTEAQENVTNTIGNWTAVSEPNDGLWSKADLGNIRVGIQTKPNMTSDVGVFRVFEVWARVYSPVVKYFDVRAFSPTAISGYSYLSVNINCSIFIGGCSYKTLISVGSKNTTLQNWSDVPQIDPRVLAWERVTEPNDGWWNHTDLGNMRIIIETQIIKSQNDGEFRVYEAWALISPPTVNLYPSNNEVSGVTVTNPEKAYDKNQMTYASINLPALGFGTYFAVKSFNTTTPKEYASLDIYMRYNVTTSAGGQYKIHVYVGGMSVDLQVPTNDTLSEPIIAVWPGVCEPNDAVWSQADLGNLQVRVEKATDDGTCTFREYETWVTFPKDSFTVRVNVSGILSSKALYTWQFNLTFNKDVLQVVTVAEGPFLKQATYTSFAGFTVGDGWVYAGSTVFDFFVGGAYGSGALATVTFRPIAKGNSVLSFSDTQLRTFIGTLIPIYHTRSPGWFQYLAGDVNGDAKVDVYDLHQLGGAYGTISSGNPSYDWDADQDKDGDVDVDDLTTVKVHYGDT